MSKRIIVKLLASMLIVSLTFANLMVLGEGIFMGVKAAYEELEKQSTKANKFVDFDSYFTNDGTNTHSAVSSISAKDMKLYISVDVKDKGYLNNISIKLNDDANFKISDEAKKLDNIESVNSNEIKLNKISSGNKAVIGLPITAVTAENYSLNNLNKESIVTLTATYVNAKGKTSNVEKSIKVRLGLDEEIEAHLEQEVNSYVPFDIEGNRGVILQTIVKSKLVDNKLPVESTDVIAKIPNINGVKPESIRVSANSTVATNGNNNGLYFNNDNYSYDEETVTINVKNSKDNNNISWKNGTDEYVITYVFGEEAYGLENAKITLEAKNIIKAYNYAGTKEATKEASKDVVLKEKLNDIVNYKLETSASNISKGYMYADNDTEYKTMWNIDVTYKDIINKIILTDTGDKLLSNDKTVDLKSIYEQTVVSKNNFDKVLGEDGYIKVTSESGVVSEINKDTTPDENGNLIIDYSDVKTSKVTVEISKPVEEGVLKFENTKVFSGNTGYDKNIEKEFTNIQTNLYGKTVYTENLNTEKQNIKNIKLDEPYTKAEISMSNPNLSTITKNENVKFTVVLRSNDTKYDLYKNPVIEIQLPGAIERVDIKDIDLLFEEELKILGKPEVYTNESGNKVIRIALSGTQTKYNTGNVNGGTNIVITADLIVNNLTPSQEKNVTVSYTNENVNRYENNGNKGVNVAKVNFVAPVGVVTVNALSNYKDNAEVVSLTGEENIGTLDIQSAGRTATMSLTVINNYDREISNIRILGRTPFKGNKSIKDNGDLGTTFDAKMKAAITSVGVSENKFDIYYSSNGDATEDLNNSENGWTKSQSDYSKVKSYLVVFKDYTMKQGEKVSFKYDVNIPEQLQYNESAYGTYVVYYDNVISGQTVKDSAIATVVGASTGEGPVFNTSMKATANDNEIAEAREYQRVKYTINIENKGNIDATNVKVSAPIPEGTTYTYYFEDDEMEKDSGYITDDTVKQKTWDIGTIVAGTSKQVEFEVEINELNNDKIISAIAKITADKLLAEVNTNTVEFTAKTSDIRIVAESMINPNIELQKGNEICYGIRVTNISDRKLENIELKDVLPQEITYVDAYILKYEESNNEDMIDNADFIRDGIKYDENLRQLTYKVNSLEAGESFFLMIEATVNNVEKKSETIYIVNNATVKAKGTEEYVSNNVRNTIVSPKLVVTIESNKPNEYIKEGDEIVYTITVKNEGSGDATGVTISDKLPEGLNPIKAVYSINGGQETTELLSRDETFEINENILAGQTLVAKVTAIVERITDDQDDRIVNKVSVSSEDIERIETEEITHQIEKTTTVEANNESSNGSNRNNSNIENKYKITGKAWLDENKSGSREETEKLLEGINVKLLNEDTGKVISNTTTNSSGEYTFSDLSKGKYIVIFKYDSGTYNVTEYKKDGIDERLNSDAISSTIEENGEKVIAAITNTVEVKDVSISNIDLGLITNPTFDLKLDKSVKKIAVQTSKGTKTYDYEDSKLAKVEIYRKQVSGANVMIEYSIKVTNEGDIAGYAKKIVDYIPQELKFNSELNKNWYVTENGVAYNSSLANEAINPGETKEVTIILTKSMTENNTGIISNTAEIQESYNNYGITDTDSKVANKIAGEDDLSSADVILAVSTGEVILYIGLTIIVLIGIAAGAYYINKKVLKV